MGGIIGKKLEVVTVFRPDAALRDPAALARGMIRDLRDSLDLAWQLAVRDIRAQYRQAALGLMWAFILPIANAATWLFIHASGSVQIARTSLPYPVFVVSGTLFWAIFVDAANAPLQQATLAKPMLSKISFPREALLVSGLLQTGFNAAIKVVMLFALLVAFGVHPNGNMLLTPAMAMLLILAGTTFGVLLVPAGMLYADIARGLPLLLQLMMYLSPVVYAIPASGRIAQVMAANPLSVLVSSARESVTGQAISHPLELMLIGAALLLVLLVGWLVYRISMPILIERMNA